MHPYPSHLSGSARTLNYAQFNADTLATLPTLLLNMRLLRRRWAPANARIEIGKKERNNKSTHARKKKERSKERKNDLTKKRKKDRKKERQKEREREKERKERKKDRKTEWKKERKKEEHPN